jgi:Na+/melibiose symporter-like transporter
MVVAYAMGFITLFAFPYVQKIVGGSEQHQYAVIGIVFGAIAALGTLACGLLTKERLKPVRAEKFSFKPFKDLFKNKPWIYLTLIGICTNFFNGFRYAAAGYMFDYVLGKEITISSLIINYTVFMTFGEVTCMIFGGLSPKFTQWVGSKRKAFIWAALICVFFSVLFFFIPRDPSYIWVLIAIVVLTSVGIGLYSPLLWSMYADVADYATEKNGTSSTGLIFSSGTMAQKFGTAISGSLVVLLMGIAGFSSGTMSVNDKIVPEEGAVNVTYVDQKEQKQSMISIKGDEAAKFMEWSTLSNDEIISNADGKVEVNADGLNKLRNRIASLSGETQLTTVEMDKSGNNTVITIEKMDSVRTMVWLLFSIFPAIFALLIVFLTKLYPIKK